MTIRWRRGFRRIAIALTVLWLVPIGAVFTTTIFEKGAMIFDPQKFLAFLIGPVVIVWTVYFLGAWCADGFIDPKKEKN